MLQFSQTYVHVHAAHHIYTDKHTHTYTYICKNTYTYTHKNTCTYTHAHAHTLKCVFEYAGNKCVHDTCLTHNEGTEESHHHSGC